MILWLLIILFCLSLAACAVLTQAKFGKNPGTDMVTAYEKSTNYKDGKFQYPIETPLFAEGTGMLSILLNRDNTKADNLSPQTVLPTVKTDLHSLDPQQDLVIWLGHSSWFIQVDGKRILVDPVLSDYAAPFSFLVKAYKGTSVYQFEDIPAIDVLLISHDHYDHLDYSTMVNLAVKIDRVICPLGIAAHFLHWGYPAEMLSEGDWYDEFVIENKLSIQLMPARHYSGRLFSKNRTLWSGFMITSSQHRIFYSGDSGYGPHFKEIGKQVDSIDIAMLDSGQYDHRWPLIHMTPEEAAQATKDLGARILIPAHVGRFTLANHPWNEPFKRLSALQDQDLFLATPKIGEITLLDKPNSNSSAWWRNERNNTNQPGH